MSLIDIYYGLQKMETGKPITLNIHELGWRKKENKNGE